MTPLVKEFRLMDGDVTLVMGYIHAAMDRYKQ